MGSGIFALGTRTMFANSAQLETVGHNISNANTEGYSRQEVQLATENGRFTGAWTPKHYDDQAEAYIEGVYQQAHFSDEEVSANTRSTLTERNNSQPGQLLDWSLRVLGHDAARS